MHLFGAAVTVAYVSAKDPITVAYSFEVLLLSPCSVFLGMSAPGPSLYHFMNEPVDLVKDAFAGYVTVIVRPSANNAVELYDQVTGLCVQIGLDDRSHLVKQRLDTALCRSNEQLGVVFA